MTVAWPNGVGTPDQDGVLELAEAVRSRAVSAVELTNVSLERARRDATELGSFSEILFERARQQAHRVDRAVRDGREVGPLAGVPVSIKDAIWLEGVRATHGSIALRDFVPGATSAAVASLEQAGAVIVGKTNNPEFCLFGYTDGRLLGPARNPYDRTLTAGGSSGGAAASIASGATPLALGSDGGGSIRGPASFCGVVGHKPTFGLVPNEPSFDVWPTLSVDGPLGRSVLDVSVMLEVLAGPEAQGAACGSAGGYVGAAREPGETLGNATVAWSADLGFASVDPAVRAVFEDAVQELADAGVHLIEDHPRAGNPTSTWTDIATCEGFAALAPLLEFESAMWPGVAEIIRAGDRPATAYLQAQTESRRLTAVWARFFTRYDLLLTPMMQVPPFAVGETGPTEIDGKPVDPFFDDWSNLCYPANLTGQPASSVPIGYTADRLPVGMQVIGPRNRDDRVLAFSSLTESVVQFEPGARAR